MAPGIWPGMFQEFVTIGQTSKQIELPNLYWLVVSTHLKNISKNGNLPQLGVKIKIFETTTYL